MVSVQGHFDPEQRGLEVRGVHLHTDFFQWYILLFQPRFAESRDAGLWIHGEAGIRRADCGYVWRCCSTHVVQGSTVLLIPATPWVVQWSGLLQPWYPDCPAASRHLGTILRDGIEEGECLSSGDPHAVSQAWSRGALKKEPMPVEETSVILRHVWRNPLRSSNFQGVATRDNSDRAFSG